MFLGQEEVGGIDRSIPCASTYGFVLLLGSTACSNHEVYDHGA